MRAVPASLFRLFATIALITAMVVSAFAHTGARPSLSPELTAYVAAGGLLADICGSSEEQDGAQGQKCEACRLVGAAILPRDCYGIPLVLTDQTRVLSFVAKRLLYAHPIDPARLTRAPPQA